MMGRRGDGKDGSGLDNLSYLLHFAFGIRWERGFCRDRIATCCIANGRPIFIRPTGKTQEILIELVYRLRRGAVKPSLLDTLLRLFTYFNN